jgi:hypothetical protein
MSTIASQETLASQETSRTLPYAPSWIDRLTDWVRARPLPPWLTYLLLGVALALIEMAIKWSDGTYPVGTIDYYHLAVAATGPTILTLLHYLDDWAADALAAFRPAMRVDEAEYRLLRYELTTLPRWFALAVTALFGIFVTGGIALLSSPAQSAELRILTSPLAAVVDMALFVFIWALVGTIAYHTVHQLRMASRIHRDYAQINLFQPSPLYAFSRLTSRTALGLAFVGYGWYLIQSGFQSLSGLYNVVTAFPALVLAVATFVLPLLGIHRMLQAEKDKLVSEAARRMEMVIAELHRSTDQGDFEKMAGLNSAMDGLVKEQSVLEKIPTWPWQTETLRGFVTALLLPLVLWFITKLLERFANF